MGQTNGDECWSFLPEEGATCKVTYVSDGKIPHPEIPEEHRQGFEKAAHEFLHESGGDVCILLAGPLQSEIGSERYSTENAVANCCRALLGDPSGPRYSRTRTIDLVLDTLGGSLDSAFKTVVFLSRFTSDLRVYVPRRAKSAGTLIAIGTRNLYLTPFSELGPLDTQIRDPRDPTETLSALDCYQSVDYVREFGLSTLKRALIYLTREMKTGIPLADLVATASEFANASTGPMLAQVRALDFGGWGRTLKIGELYTQSLLRRAGYDDARIKSIATKLVYGYTHHPYPIDMEEAADIGLTVQPMKPSLSAPALEMVTLSAGLHLGIAVGGWEKEKTETKHALPVSTAGARGRRPTAAGARAARPTADGHHPDGADDEGEGEGAFAGRKEPVAVVGPLHYATHPTEEIADPLHYGQQGPRTGT